MADMDPMIREALKRSSQMQGNIPKNQRQSHHIEKPKRAESQQQEDNKSGVFSEPLIQENSVSPKKENTLDMLLKNQDQSLIFLLMILLMGEDSDPSLLLALMYLLI